MKNNDIVYAIGDIDPRLIEGAEKDGKASAPKKEHRLFGFKRVALVALAVILTVGGLLMLNENVRAAVIGSFIRRSENSVDVSFVNPDAESESESDKTNESVVSAEAVSIYDVSVEYIPDGLIMEDLDAIHDVARFVYLEIELGNAAKDFPYVQMSISRSGQFPRGFGGDNFDEKVYQSSINGMDAYILASSCDYFGETVECVQLLFGDEDITVDIQSTGLSLEEVTKIAENIVW